MISRRRSPPVVVDRRGRFRFGIGLIWGALIPMTGCQAPAERPGLGRDRAVGDGVVALIGPSATISEAALRKAQRDSGLSPQRALDEMLKARLSRLACEAGQLEGSRLAMVRRSVMARAMLEDVDRQVRRGGPPTDEEIERLTQQRWLDLDRPLAVQTTHFVVRVTNPADAEPARALAQRIREGVRHAPDPDGFLRAARGVDPGQLTVVAESLPPLTADGRSYGIDEAGKPTTEGPRFDLTFARAAHHLREPGEISPLVRTNFGFHAIRLDRVLDAHRIPLEQRRSLLQKEAMEERGRSALRTLIETLRSRAQIVVESQAAGRTAQVPVSQ